jgi:hypothetical protein
MQILNQQYIKNSGGDFGKLDGTGRIEFNCLSGNSNCQI